VSPTGTRTLDFITITDSNNSSGTTILCSNDCTNGGGNSNWAFPATVTVYSDEGSTAFSSGTTVAISINGATKSTADTNGSGIATFTSLAFSSGDVVAVWLDDETENGMAVTITNGTTLGFNIYQNRLLLQHETGSSITNANLATADGSGDDDITAIYTEDSGDITVADGIEVFINGSDTYTPGGAVTLDDIDINGTFTMSSNDVVVSGTWDATGGTFTSSGGVTFDSITTETITSNGNSFYDLTYNLTIDGVVTNSDTLNVTGTLTANSGAVSSPPDSTPPTISNIAASAGETAATISWTTDEAADSKVGYGVSASLGTEQSDSSQSILHAIRIPGLSANTTYHYQVTSVDGSSNSTSSTTTTFTTANSVGDTTAPSVSSVSATSVTSGEAEISWTTDENTIGYVNYGTTTTYDSAAGTGNNTYNTSKTATLTGLSASTTYHYQVIAIDAAGNLTTHTDATFTTAASTILEATETFNETEVTEGEDPPDLSSKAPAVTDVKGTSVTISWTTDKEATSVVYYRVLGSAANISSLSNGSLVKDHTVTLTGLTESTAYEYSVESTDGSGNSVRSKTYQFTTSLPAVSDVSIQQLTDQGAEFSFITESATSTILELTNLDTGELVTFEDDDLALQHRVSLADLRANSRYGAVILIRGEDGAVARSISYIFETRNDSLDPIITSINTRSALVEGADAVVQTIITWETNEATSSQVEFNEGLVRGENAEYTQSTEESEDFVVKHVVVLTELQPSMVYQYRVRSVDRAGNEQVSEPRVLLTPSRQVSALDLIINNLEDTFGWARQLRFNS